MWRKNLPLLFNRVFVHVRWLAGFLNHQQFLRAIDRYICRYPSLRSFECLLGAVERFLHDHCWLEIVHVCYPFPTKWVGSLKQSQSKDRHETQLTKLQVKAKRGQRIPYWITVWKHTNGLCIRCTKILNLRSIPSFRNGTKANKSSTGLAQLSGNQNGSENTPFPNGSII